uniref:Acyl-homoserine-lactone synthase n=1 Tax=Dinoroseobacter phage vB_DshS_R26L TaxID=3161158 RepID=A0AAU7VFS9_9CAUD
MITECYPLEDTPLFAEMFKHRGDQFVSRLKWNIGVDESGAERDQFDDDLAAYLIQHEGDRHLASMRYRWMITPTLVSDVFPQFQEFVYPDAHGIEVTRFCAAPGGTFDGTELMRVGREHARSIGGEVLYGIFTPAMPRIYRRFGWETEVLAKDGNIWFGAWIV